MTFSNKPRASLVHRRVSSGHIAPAESWAPPPWDGKSNPWDGKTTPDDDVIAHMRAAGHAIAAAAQEPTDDVTMDGQQPTGSTQGKSDTNNIKLQHPPRQAVTHIPSMEIQETPYQGGFTTKAKACNSLVDMCHADPRAVDIAQSLTTMWQVPF